MSKWNRFFVVSICVLLVLSCFSCSQKSGSELIDKESSPAVQLKVPTGEEVLCDLFFANPVLTSSGDITMMGTKNKTIATYVSRDKSFLKWINERTIEAHFSPSNNDREIANPPFSEANSEYVKYYQTNNPTWVPTGTFLVTSDRRILGMTQNTRNLDIYLLTEKKERLEDDFSVVSEDDSASYSIKLYPSNYVIELVRQGAIVEEHAVNKNLKLDHIQYCRIPDSKKEFILASDEKGQFHFANGLELQNGFIPLFTTLPKLRTWDLAGTTLLGLDEESVLHLYTVEFDETNGVTLEEKSEFSTPCEKPMVDPVIQFNPVTQCIVLWDAVLNGESYYIVYNGEMSVHRWYTLKVAPMNVIMISPNAIQQVAEGYPSQTKEYWNKKESFYYLGIPDHQSELKMYKIYP